MPRAIIVYRRTGNSTSIQQQQLQGQGQVHPQPKAAIPGTLKLQTNGAAASDAIVEAVQYAYMDSNGSFAARNHDEVEVLALIDVRTFSFFHLWHFSHFLMV